MSDANDRTRFLAVLVFEDGVGWRCEEPHIYTVSHPEIAYQLAVADGEEQRFGRTFVGLSHLGETTEEIQPIACCQRGDATELVVAKSKLVTFNDPKWVGTCHNEQELRDALAEPDILVDFEGFDEIPWHTLDHAYGLERYVQALPSLPEKTPVPGDANALPDEALVDE